MNVLLNYAWPGNIRELENAVEGACVTSPNESIHPENFPPEPFKALFNSAVANEQDKEPV
jgi:DNA-binding NtrC family response regulator